MPDNRVARETQSQCSISLAFSELKVIAAATPPEATSFVGDHKGSNTSPEKLEEDADYTAPNTELMASTQIPWLSRLITGRKVHFNAATQTLNGTLGDLLAVKAFVELMASIQLDDTELSIHHGKTRKHTGGWSEPYIDTHAEGISAERLQVLQQRSMLHLVTKEDVGSFMKTFVNCNSLSDHFLERILDVKYLPSGKSVVLNAVSVLFGYNPAVNYKYHQDSKANPRHSTTHITCVVQLGPGGSNFKVAGAKGCGYFTNPGDFHAFHAGLFHRSGATTSLTMKLVLFYKVIWPNASSDASSSGADQHRVEGVDQNPSVTVASTLPPAAAPKQPTEGPGLSEGASVPAGDPVTNASGQKGAGEPGAETASSSAIPGSSADAPASSADAPAASAGAPASADVTEEVQPEEATTGVDGAEVFSGAAVQDADAVMKDPSHDSEEKVVNEDEAEGTGADEAEEHGDNKDEEDGEEESDEEAEEDEQAEEEEDDDGLAVKPVSAPPEDIGAAFQEMVAPRKAAAVDPDDTDGAATSTSSGATDKADEPNASKKKRKTRWDKSADDGPEKGQKKTKKHQTRHSSQ